MTADAWTRGAIEKPITQNPNDARTSFPRGLGGASHSDSELKLVKPADIRSVIEASRRSSEGMWRA